jgi:hypothetical protein
MISMTQGELLKKIETDNFGIVTAQEFHTLFPGKPLSDVEQEFKVELFKSGGPAFNPRGKSQQDKVVSFCSEHQLSFRWVGGRVLFYRGRIVVESIVAAMESGIL